MKPLLHNAETGWVAVLADGNEYEIEVTDEYGIEINGTTYTEYGNIAYKWLYKPIERALLKVVRAYNPKDTIQILPPPLKQHCMNKKLSDCSFEELCCFWHIFNVNGLIDKADDLFAYIKSNYQEEIDNIKKQIAIEVQNETLF